MIPLVLFLKLLLEALDVLQCLCLADHIAVLGIDVEEVGFMRPVVAITNTLANHDWPEAVLNGING
jgi:hypothetical protein